ncbi:heme-binding protein [Methylosinus sporium]|uniref:Heme-binding protein n=1 Tax=Methylosinus sporium TaxID=428 RepID=A0A549SXS8_METSR|nr:MULTISPECIES: heme-binding protein [Methylosinus]MBU3889347.1 heme-binding protein [Methylosinus sp. KRF6]TRL34445.1 heme-binding protein [Methylosinus sporium]
MKSKILASFAAAGALIATLAPTHAELVTQKTLSTPIALAIAQTAYDACYQQGYRISVTVVGEQGQILIAIRGDGASPHTFENSHRKAYTSRTFRTPSGEFAQRVKDNPTTSAVHLANVIAAQGALPIKAGDVVIGGVGVSGAPGGDKDEACAKAALDKVADQLK